MYWNFIISKIQEQPGECLAVEEYFSLCLLLSLWQFWFISHINCQTTKKYMLMRITIILLGSGAVGNFIDRLFLGYVRDFIIFHDLSIFLVFNVADCYVTIGLALFIIMVLFIYKDEDFNFLKPDRKGSNE